MEVETFKYLPYSQIEQMKTNYKEISNEIGILFLKAGHYYNFSSKFCRKLFFEKS